MYLYIYHISIIFYYDPLYTYITRRYTECIHKQITMKAVGFHFSPLDLFNRFWGHNKASGIFTYFDDKWGANRTTNGWSFVYSIWPSHFGVNSLSQCQIIYLLHDQQGPTGDKIPPAALNAKDMTRDWIFEKSRSPWKHWEFTLDPFRTSFIFPFCFLSPFRRRSSTPPPELASPSQVLDQQRVV